jgi:hypothetical protein
LTLMLLKLKCILVEDKTNGNTVNRNKNLMTLTDDKRCICFPNLQNSTLDIKNNHSLIGQAGLLFVSPFDFLKNRSA